MSRASRSRSRVAASSSTARCNRSSALTASRATCPTTTPASSIRITPVNEDWPIRSRVARSAPATSSAATVPRRRPPETAQASTGPAIQATPSVGTPWVSAVRPTTHGVASTMAMTTPRSASSSGQRRQAGRAYPIAVAPVQAIISRIRAPTAYGWAYRSASRTASAQTYAREASLNTVSARHSGTSNPPGGDGMAVRMPQPGRRTASSECGSGNPDVRWKSREILRDAPPGRAHDERRPARTAYGCAHRTCPPDRRSL
ncbi:hypothetical protein ONO86_01589 [Micromonospora noduli]|nr:hypothetical protein ONO86_01589 [Micromonospora noduli]